MLKLTKKDKIILREFDNNARATLSAIGKASRLSKEAVAYRIGRLEKLGFILRYHTIVNYFRLGLQKHKLYIRLKSPSQKISSEICEYFRRGAKTEWVAQCSGRWNVIVGFIVANANEFDEEIARFLDKFSTSVLEKAVTQTLYLAHQPRGAFEGSGEIKERKKIVYHTSKDAPAKIDATDELILRILANNARASINAIARNAKISPRVAAYRISKLEKQGIILAYKAHLDPKAFGRGFYKIILSVRSIGKEAQDKLMEYCGQIPDVVWPQRVLGAWDIEIDVDADDEEKVNAMLLKIYAKFPELVADYAIVRQIKEFKLDLYPGAIPEIGR